MIGEHLPEPLDWGLWGLAATVTMTGILQGAAGLHFSRLNIPLLVGTIFTGSRRKASIGGFFLYLLGGWAFALIYLVFLSRIGLLTWWAGATLGILHGIFLLVAILPLLPFFHPRMASAYDEPTSEAKLEPPGFFGLHYGSGTPASVLIAQTAYGAMLGGLPQLAAFMG